MTTGRFQTAVRVAESLRREGMYYPISQRELSIPSLLPQTQMKNWNQTVEILGRFAEKVRLKGKE
jgi:hypothetical protein